MRSIAARGAMVQFGELFPRVEELRRECERPLQRNPGLAWVAQRFLAEAHQVERFGEPVVDLERRAQRLDGACGVPGVVPRQRELVEDLRRPIVDPDVVLEPARGPVVPLERVLEIPEDLERPCGRGVELGGHADVFQRRFELSVLAVGLPSLEISEHRARLDSDGNRERLNGGEAFPVGQGRVSLLDQAPVGLLPSVAGVAQDTRHGQGDQHRDEEDALHCPKL